jgi:hypothetical protein
MFARSACQQLATVREQLADVRARPNPFREILMKRWLSIPGRRTVSLVALVCVAAATPLAAQQASTPAPRAGAGAVQASAASSPLPGPRLRPEWQRWEASLAEDSAPANVAAAAGSHTIRVTTLVLVLGVIIAVLLIAN